MSKDNEGYDPNAEEENSEERSEERGENSDASTTEERADPFAALELPPPVGADDDLRDDWDGEEFSEEEAPQPSPHDPTGDYSAMAAAGEGAQLNTKTGANMNMMMDELNMFGNMGGHGGDADLDAFNDPNIEHLDDPPFIGGQPQSMDLFGKSAMGPMGRATSPRLYAQASQFPTCTQLRCWKWENGVPVGLGVIDAMATEEDFVQTFFEAMPRKGETKCRFKLRPIDINGQEMGKEINMLISEHHAALQQIRDRKSEEGPGGMGWGQPIPEDPSATMASEMSRMMDTMMRTSDRRTHILEESLEAERERMRLLDEERAQERVDMAMNAAQGVQALTERMMHDESARAQRSMSMQNEQSNVLINTLTSVFGNQHQMMQQFSQQQQVMDNRRLEREQQRAERERQDMELRRQRDQLEFEQRRQVERDEIGEKRKEMDDSRRWEREQQDLKRQAEDRKWERQMEEMRLRVEKDRGELERRLTRDREEMLLKLKMEQEESSRKMQYERERMEREEGRRREDRDRQGQLDREHQERMARFTTLEKESQREAAERRERLEREAREATEKERERRHMMMMKEMELSKERDREHAERMLTMSKAEMATKGFGGLTEMVPKAAGLLRDFGLEPADLVGRLLGGQEESGGGWMETLPKMLGAASEVVKAGLAAKGGMMPQLPMMGPDFTPALGAPPPEMLTPEILQQQEMAEHAQMARVRRRQMRQQQQQMEAIRQQQERMVQHQQAEGAQSPPEASPENPPAPSAEETDAPISPPEQEEMTPAQKAKAAGMKLRDQRNARNGLRKLVKELNGTPDAEWEGKIMVALASEIAIFHYIQAVTVVGALGEAGADNDVITKVMDGLKKSDMVPADINYGVIK